MKKSYLYAGLALLGFGLLIGGLIANIIFIGIITAGSLVILVQTAGREFKLGFARCAVLLDVILFILSALAVAKLGVTIAGGLAVASLLFTLYRVNFLMPWYRRNVTPKVRSFKSYVAQAFNSVVGGFKSLFSF